MKFLYKPSNPIQGRLSYIDNAIGFEPVKEVYKPARHPASAALTVDRTLQIEFLVDSGCLLYAWGYLPEESWQADNAQLPLDRVRPGMIFATEVDDPVIAGVGYSTNLDTTPTRYLKKSGHLIIGDPNTADNLVEIASNTIIGLKGDQLSCVILKPEML